MTITFFGTSAGKPTKQRNLSAIALRYEQKNEWYLIDCGEATQHQIMKSDYRLGKLTKIFITHLHGDHCYGLPGLLSSRIMENISTPLEIYGPKGIKEYLENIKKLTKIKLLDYTEIIEICDKSDSTSCHEDNGTKFNFDTFDVEVISLDHGITTFAYCFFEHISNGSIDVKGLESIGIMSGKIYGDLKKGKTVLLNDGTKIEPKEFLLEPIRGRRVIIAGDNCKPDILGDRLNNLDLLVHEATFTQEVFENLEEKVKHTTAKQLAIAAQNGGVKNLIATHISPRYIKNPAKLQNDINLLDKEIEKYFKGNYFIANDFDAFLLDRKSFELKKL
ncbi:MAG: MBL fold metallo-hydrolase [Arcobacteraceae bacterium]|nr:MBL fold metallo-hydrolase [Arcobacteraceae bacterium]